MADLINQKVLRITDKSTTIQNEKFITEDVVEVNRIKLIYYKWVSRLMTLLATISFAYCISCTLVLLKLVPSILIDAQIFVMFSDSDALVEREYISSKMDLREKIMVNFMKQYIELRNTYIKDPAEMRKRWEWGGLISYLSTRNIYKEFEERYPILQKEMEDKKASRSVEILSVKRFEVVEKKDGKIVEDSAFSDKRNKKSIWKVEFKTYDYTYGSEHEYRPEGKVGPYITEHYWTANISCHADPYRRTNFKRLINPLGFVVYKYFQGEADN